MTNRADYRRVRAEGHPPQTGTTQPEPCEPTEVTAAMRLADALGLDASTFQLAVITAHLEEAHADGRRFAVASMVSTWERANFGEQK